jgi:signal peptidase I/conjugal transfer pilin signal peptidase TrbI
MPIHFGFACKTEKCLKNIKTGDIIIFKKYFEDKYIPDNGILIKYVMCNEGDNLTVDSDKIYYCNGQFFTVAKDTDSKGNPVKNFVYNGKIPKGKVFVSGVGRNSYDSKYFGFIDKDKILYKVYPIL